MRIQKRIKDQKSNVINTRLHVAFLKFRLGVIVALSPHIMAYSDSETTGNVRKDKKEIKGSSDKNRTAATKHFEQIKLKKGLQEVALFLVSYFQLVFPLL